MEQEFITNALYSAANSLSLIITAPPAYGWHYKSAGSKVTDSNGNVRWLRVIAWPRHQKNERVWYGAKSTTQIKGVRKPSWFSDYEWDINEMRCRADILEFIADKLISDTPDLRCDFQPTEKWLSDLRISLEELHTTPTDRVSVRQDLVTRRLRERFGQNVDANVLEWETSHGDLHWANLTSPVCFLLDWEAWGVAPKAFDVALLYLFTLQQPRAARMLYDCFKDWLDNPIGHKAQMFACAELLRMSETYADHLKLYPFLIRRAEELSSLYNLTVLKPQ